MFAYVVGVLGLMSGHVNGVCVGAEVDVSEASVYWWVACWHWLVHELKMLAECVETGFWPVNEVVVVLGLM